ncbi:hypothetical protein HDV05_000990 [Chytridiales sp. JEL 0842]|nr:hypothetical protein HDV05_000990 [Chytridiales sp. JEL 0842]
MTQSSPTELPSAPPGWVPGIELGHALKVLRAFDWPPTLALRDSVDYPNVVHLDLPLFTSYPPPPPPIPPHCWFQPVSTLLKDQAVHEEQEEEGEEVEECGDNDDDFYDDGSFEMDHDCIPPAPKRSLASAIGPHDQDNAVSMDAADDHQHSVNNQPSQSANQPSTFQNDKPPPPPNNVFDTSTTTANGSSTNVAAGVKRKRGRPSKSDTPSSHANSPTGSTPLAAGPHNSHSPNSINTNVNNTQPSSPANTSAPSLPPAALVEKRRKGVEYQSRTDRQALRLNQWLQDIRNLFNLPANQPLPLLDPNNKTTKTSSMDPKDRALLCYHEIALYFDGSNHFQPVWTGFCQHFPSILSSPEKLHQLSAAVTTLARYRVGPKATLKAYKRELTNLFEFLDPQMANVDYLDVMPWDQWGLVPDWDPYVFVEFEQVKAFIYFRSEHPKRPIKVETDGGVQGSKRAVLGHVNRAWIVYTELLHTISLANWMTEREMGELSAYSAELRKMSDGGPQSSTIRQQKGDLRQQKGDLQCNLTPDELQKLLLPLLNKSARPPSTDAAPSTKQPWIYRRAITSIWTDILFAQQFRLSRAEVFEITLEHVGISELKKEAAGGQAYTTLALQRDKMKRGGLFEKVYLMATRHKNVLLCPVAAFALTVYALLKDFVPTPANVQSLKNYKLSQVILPQQNLDVEPEKDDKAANLPKVNLKAFIKDAEGGLYSIADMQNRFLEEDELFVNQYGDWKNQPNCFKNLYASKKILRSMAGFSLDDPNSRYSLPRSSVPISDTLLNSIFPWIDKLKPKDDIALVKIIQTLRALRPIIVQDVASLIANGHVYPSLFDLGLLSETGDAVFESTEFREVVCVGVEKAERDWEKAEGERREAERRKAERKMKKVEREEKKRRMDAEKQDEGGPEEEKEEEKNGQGVVDDVQMADKVEEENQEYLNEGTVIEKISIEAKLSTPLHRTVIIEAALKKALELAQNDLNYDDKKHYVSVGVMSLASYQLAIDLVIKGFTQRAIENLKVGIEKCWDVTAWEEERDYDGSGLYWALMDERDQSGAKMDNGTIAGYFGAG